MGRKTITTWSGLILAIKKQTLRAKAVLKDIECHGSNIWKQEEELGIKSRQCEIDVKFGVMNTNEDETLFDIVVTVFEWKRA